MSVGARVGPALVILVALVVTYLGTTWRDHEDVAACAPLYAAARSGLQRVRLSRQINVRCFADAACRALTAT